MANIDSIKGIIFDYGGTLDSRGVHWSEIIREGYNNANVDVDYNDFRNAYVFAERELARVRHILPHHTFFDLLYRKMQIELQYLVGNNFLPEDFDVDTNSEKIATYCYNHARECIEEARPTLEALYNRLPLVLVSNFYGNVNAVLDDFDLSRYFKDVVESAVVGVRKPDPAIFMLGVKALNLNPDEVLVVGDSLGKDIIPAQSIGCHVLWLKGKGWTLQEDSQQHPNIIKNLKEILSASF